MSQTKKWSENEDKTFVKLILDSQDDRDSQIAKTMENNYQQIERIEKGCTQKCLNNLNSTTKGQNWTQQDSSKLFEYHAIHGNRWAKIALLFGDRSDNSVKNHFYSTLRKAHRIINKFIKQYRKKLSHRPIKDNVLSKIISLSDQSPQLQHSKELTIKSKDLLYRLVNIAQSQTEENSVQFMKQVINDLLEINKGYKLKKSDKRKRKLTLISQESKVSSDIDEQLSKKMIKRPTQTSISQKESEDFKQGFRLFVPSCNLHPKMDDIKMNYFQNQAVQSINKYCLFYNNQLPYFICGYPYTQNGMFPLFYPSTMQNQTH